MANFVPLRGNEGVRGGGSGDCEDEKVRPGPTYGDPAADRNFSDRETTRLRDSARRCRCRKRRGSQIAPADAAFVVLIGFLLAVLPAVERQAREERAAAEDAVRVPEDLAHRAICERPKGHEQIAEAESRQAGGREVDVQLQRERLTRKAAQAVVRPVLSG